MYIELLFATLVVLTTIYMCQMINEGPGNFGYRRFHTDDDDYSTSESEFRAFHSGSPAPSPRSSRWSSSSSGGEGSDGTDQEQDLINMDLPTAEPDTPSASSSTLSDNGSGNHVTDPVLFLTPEESEISAEIEPQGSLVYRRLEPEPRHTVGRVEVPWIINPLYQESASSSS